jgi:hypothetical protein
MSDEELRESEGDRWSETRTAEMRANARLIAAAPELHYALGLLLASHTDREDECVAVKRARAALALVNKPDTNSANSTGPAHGQAS